jgi:hypothetical protein
MIVEWIMDMEEEEEELKNIFESILDNINKIVFGNDDINDQK